MYIFYVYIFFLLREEDIIAVKKILQDIEDLN